MWFLWDSICCESHIIDHQKIVPQNEINWLTIDIQIPIRRCWINDQRSMHHFLIEISKFWATVDQMSFETHFVYFENSVGCFHSMFAVNLAIVHGIQWFVETCNNFVVLVVKYEERIFALQRKTTQKREATIIVHVPSAFMSRDFYDLFLLWNSCRKLELCIIFRSIECISSLLITDNKWSNQAMLRVCSFSALSAHGNLNDENRADAR